VGPAVSWLWWTLVITLSVLGIPVLVGIDGSGRYFRVTQPYRTQGLLDSSGAMGATAVSVPLNS